MVTSLDATHELLPYVPTLLSGLKCLGFPPDGIVETFIQLGFAHTPGLQMLDLGCGKGALLNRLAWTFGWHGVGVDFMPSFIQEAGAQAERMGLTKRLQFHQTDIAQFVKTASPANLVIFGFDHHALGTFSQAIMLLSKLLQPKGYLLIDFCWADQAIPEDDLVVSEVEISPAITAANLIVKHQHTYSPAWVKRCNAWNTAAISNQAQKLAKAYPAKSDLFQSYLQGQNQACMPVSNAPANGFLLLQKP